jgi:hypothetical protein
MYEGINRVTPTEREYKHHFRTKLEKYIIVWIKGENMKYLFFIVLLLIFVGGCVSSSDFHPSISNTKCVLPLNSSNSLGQTITQKYPYSVNGVEDSVELTLNQQWRDYFACRSDEFGPQATVHQNITKCHDNNCISTIIDYNSEFELANETKRYSVLKPLTDAIKSKSTDPEMQARIAISLVQNLQYDYQKEEMVSKTIDKYHYASPYEVLYSKSGMCAEKSVLLAELLNELGFESALFKFSKEKHAMVGIGVSESDSYQYPGYILIETTTPLRIGLMSDKISSTPKIVKFPGALKFHLSSQDRT